MIVVYQKEEILNVEEEMNFDIADNIAPDPKDSSFLAEMRRVVYGSILRYRGWKCTRCHAYLMKHDLDYRFDQERKELIRARKIAREQGVNPESPEYPKGM